METEVTLSADELKEIERKVARFRESVTQAAIRRIEKYNPKLIERREMRQLLRSPATKLAILERMIAGEKLDNLATEYKFGKDFMRSYVRDIILDQLSGNDDEWAQALHIWKLDGVLATFGPLALQRLKDRAPDR